MVRFADSKAALPRCVTFVVGAIAVCLALPWTRPAAQLRADETTANSEEDLFQVPQTDDPAELVKFIDEVRAARPLKLRGPAGYRASRRYEIAAGPAITAASEKILTLADKKSEAYASASGALLEAKVASFADAEPEDRVKLLDEVIAHLQQYGVRETEAGIAYGMSQAFEKLGDAKTAARAYRQFGELVKASDDEAIRDLESAFSGPGRRLGLVGSEMEVFGKTLAGEDFDFSKYKGKVVLVDFWATWCGPCVAELPNVKEAYEKYHDQGFEVIGVSLDERRIALDEFLKENELPWVQLHGEEGPNKLATHYDVRGIPFIVLVGRDGKVISVEARGRQLHDELAKIFGPVAADANQSSENQSDAATTDDAPADEAQAGE